MFASYFVAEGLKTYRKADELAPKAEKQTAAVSSLLQRATPRDLSSYVPETPRTWVRLVSVSQVVGGVMFAAGIGRRCGAAMLAGSSAWNTALALPAKDASAHAKELGRAKALRNVAFTGAALLATQDLQGKPSWSWRSAEAAKQNREAKAKEISRKVRRAEKKAAAKAKKLAKRAAKVAD